MLILDVHGYGQWDLYLYLPVGLSSHADVRSTLNPPPSAPCPLLSALGITLPPPSVRTSFVDDPLVARERNMVRMKMRMMGGINQAPLWTDERICTACVSVVDDLQAVYVDLRGSCAAEQPSQFRSYIAECYRCASYVEQNSCNA